MAENTRSSTLPKLLVAAALVVGVILVIQSLSKSPSTTDGAAPPVESEDPAATQVSVNSTSETTSSELINTGSGTFALINQSGSVWTYNPTTEPRLQRPWNTETRPPASNVINTGAGTLALIDNTGSIWTYNPNGIWSDDPTIERPLERRWDSETRTPATQLINTGSGTFALINQSGSVWTYNPTTEPRLQRPWNTETRPPATGLINTGAGTLALIDNTGSIWTYNPNGIWSDDPTIERPLERRWDSETRTPATQLINTGSGTFALINQSGSVWTYNPTTEPRLQRPWNTETRPPATGLINTGAGTLALIDNTGSIWTYNPNGIWSDDPTIERPLERRWDSETRTPATQLINTGSGTFALINQSGSVWTYNPTTEPRLQRPWNTETRPPATGLINTGAGTLALIDNTGSIWTYNPNGIWSDDPTIERPLERRWDSETRTPATQLINTNG